MAADVGPVAVEFHVAVDSEIRVLRGIGQRFEGNHPVIQPVACRIHWWRVQAGQQVQETDIRFARVLPVVAVGPGVGEDIAQALQYAERPVDNGAGDVDGFAGHVAELDVVPRGGAGAQTRSGLVAHSP